MLKSSKKEKFSSIPLRPVLFVTGTADLSSINKHIPSKETVVDGNEISRFYEEVINLPSMAANNKAKQKNEKAHDQDFAKKRKICLTKPTPDTMFKYSETGDLKGVRQCLDSGIDVNVTDMYGWTCLMCAACSGSRDVIKYLLENGANKDLRDSVRRTALDIAKQFGHRKVVEILNNGESVSIPEKCVMQYEKTSYFCELCKKEFSEEKQKHETSISHQLNVEVEKRTYYHIPESNVGFQMMIKKGWDKDKGLGPDGVGRKLPIKTVMKQDRLCLGNKGGKPRITHFQPFDISAVDTVKQSNSKIVRQRTLNKWQCAENKIKEKQKEINFRRQFY